MNLTYLAFIARAIAQNLRKHPGLNAAVANDATIYRRDINLGIAVALDWGLIVPVVKHADELSLMGIARAINDLGERARSKKLSPDEVQRGTFTITNPGVFGSYAGLPIINQPQVAILGVGTIEKRPAVVTLPDGTDTIAPRLKGMLTMSFDHRVVDGADADRFLADVKKIAGAVPGGRGLSMAPHPHDLAGDGAPRARGGVRRHRAHAGGARGGARAASLAVPERGTAQAVSSSSARAGRELSHRARASRTDLELQLERRLARNRRSTHRVQGVVGGSGAARAREPRTPRAEEPAGGLRGPNAPELCLHPDHSTEDLGSRLHRAGHAVHP